MTRKKKQETITFKVDENLSESLKGVTNRSEFIRAALLSALNNVCPLCMGTGLLHPEQRTHWEQFMQNHTLQRCDRCDAVHLVCRAEKGKP